MISSTRVKADPTLVLLAFRLPLSAFANIHLIEWDKKPNNDTFDNLLAKE
jgi:hypothetical protein